MPDPKDLENRVITLQRNAAALLALLGGDEADRLRFWEILKGITTPAEHFLVARSLDVMQAQLEQVEESVKVLEKTAGQMRG